MPTFNHPVAADLTMAHRIAEATITVLGADGRPIVDAEVVVAQQSHAFGFGNTGFEFIPLANGERAPDLTGMSPEGTTRSLGEVRSDDLEHLAELWLDVFNTATLPFYWGRFEPERGKPDTDRLKRTAQWFVDRGVTVKGHPLVWHTACAPWLLDLSTTEVMAAQRARIRRDVGDLAGLIDLWDAINEVVIMPVFDKEDNGVTRVARELGRIEMVRMAFTEARAANPRATLLLNDFDLSTAYECLIEGVLEAGIEIDVIGLQTHMHQGYIGEERTLAILERFSRYGLPIHLTESTLLSGHLMPPELDDLNDYQITDWPTTAEGEARQADEVVRHYTTLLSHPSVENVTYWGLSDGGWLGAPGGFIRADGTRKPSYDALRGLVKGEWWLSPTALRTDGEGRARVSGWLGDYELSAGGTTVGLTLATSGATAVEVRLPR